MDIVVINAPPSSGKDEIAAMLAMSSENIKHEQVKELLFQVAVRTSGMKRQLWDALYTRDYKERPTPYLQIDGVPVSPREWMIHCSETVVKPIFGASAFGKAAVERLKNEHPNDTIVFFSDGGFVEELSELSDYAYGTGGEFFLARVHREGYDWGNDSRGWLTLKGTSIMGHERDFENQEGLLSVCAAEILDWVMEVIVNEA